MLPWRLGFSTGLTLAVISPTGWISTSFARADHEGAPTLGTQLRGIEMPKTPAAEAGGAKTFLGGIPWPHTSALG